MTRALALAVLAYPALSPADSSARFARLREQAEPLGGLASFLEKYVGDCQSVATGGAECRQNAESYRRKATGKKFYMMVTEESVGISPEPGGGNEIILNVTPFFAAAGSAVTQGAPARTDGNGNPILPFLRVRGTVPAGESAETVSRWASMRALRLQVVFTPQGLWTLGKKGGGKIVGVRARIEGLVVTVGRTGQELGAWLSGG